VTEPAKKPATYEDLFALPEHVVGEILDGELIVSPRPASRHARASSVLGGKLMPPFDSGDGGPGGWWIIFEPELHLGRDIMVPDLAGWCRERMPEYPDVTYFELAPDWICEVASPSSARIDRMRKLPKYATYGVEFAWIVDPVARSFEVYRLVNGSWLMVGVQDVEKPDDEKVRAVPFDAIEINLAHLWT
jgi:Uma2 family endonuclease